MLRQSWRSQSLNSQGERYGMNEENQDPIGSHNDKGLFGIK
jgi:hypothetical protein